MNNREGDEENTLAVGQWGGEGGSPWDDGAYTTIRHLVIGHGAAIDSILIEYDQEGTFIWSKKHGGGGGRIDNVILDYPDEYLISISGHVSSYIRSLTFESNRRKYGPFGSQRGLPFSLPPLGRKIVGFYGKSGRLLDSIGVYLKPLKESNPLDFVMLSQNQIVHEDTDAVETKTGGTEGSVSMNTIDALKEEDEVENKTTEVRMIKIE